jgi:hypothetical protein
MQSSHLNPLRFLHVTLRAAFAQGELYSRKAALALASVLHSMATRLAEWAGMHKRIEIVMRNPGFEHTENALGVYTLDFENEAAFNEAMDSIRYWMRTTAKFSSIFVKNERDDELGINPEFYVSMRVGNVDEWQPPWLLPSHGAPPPPRENE